MLLAEALMISLNSQRAPPTSSAIDYKWLASKAITGIVARAHCRLGTEVRFLAKLHIIVYIIFRHYYKRGENESCY